MPNLNVYAGGSPGGQDGTLIDGSTSLLDFSGIYPITGVEKQIYLPIFLRCNAGFRATSVRLTTADSNFRFVGYWYIGFSYDSKYGIHSYDTWAQFDGNMAISLLSGTYFINTGYNNGTERPYIGDTNVMVIGAYVFTGAPTNGTKNMFSISYVENPV